MFVGFCGCVVGVGLRFGWGSCKLFILLPVGERLGLVPGVFAGCVWWFENSEEKFLLDTCFPKTDVI